MTNQSAVRRDQGSYFFWMSWLFLAIVVVAFGWSLGAGSYLSFEPFPPYLVVHGAVLLAWFAWFAMQTTLVRMRRVASHRRMGKAGMLIALAVLVTSPMVTLNNPGRLVRFGLDWDSDMAMVPHLGIEGQTMLDFSPLVVFGNFAALLQFAIFFGGAIYWRARSDIHKRLMLLAGLVLVPPALARISRWPIFGGEDSGFVPLALLALLLSLLVHDLVALRRVHVASWVGLIAMIAINAAAFALAGSEAGRAFVRSLV